eukprot:4232053-Amphidinium_carterae.1
MNTVRAAMKGPQSSWRRKARANIWSGIWEAYPHGVRVFKTKAHRSEQQVGSDAFERLCWAGNRRADALAKQFLTWGCSAPRGARTGA